MSSPCRPRPCSLPRRVAEYGDVIPERPLADHDSRRVLARVSRQPLELAALVEQLADARVLLVERLELRLDLERLGDGVALGGRLARDEVGDLLGLGRRDADAARDVLHDALALELREGRDLTDARLAVLLLDVQDDLVAPVHAEVDIEVRHAHALGIEEALEQQAVGDRVEVGDSQRVRDERPRPGAAARAHRDAVLLGVADEVPDDEEVPGELHLRDDVELALEASLVRRSVHRLALPARAPGSECAGPLGRRGGSSPPCRTPRARESSGASARRA